MEENDKIMDADVLYLYDAKMCNPNGDPDEENRPRIDGLTNRVLVSDVRLKRYMRDYWLATFPEDSEQDIWVRKGENESIVSANQRLQDLKREYEQKTGRKPEDKKTLTFEFKNWLLDRLLDVRLFGAVMPIKGKEAGAAGSNLTFTGPVQFSWGYSLHPVEMVLSSGITSTFAGREEGGKGEYGTMGKDWRIHYALIGFYGHISKARAVWTKLRKEDIEYMENALLYAIPHQATTRSKIGQVPRLYLKIDYRELNPQIGDLRDYVKLKPNAGIREDNIRAVSDYTLNMEELYEKLKTIEKHIAELRMWVHPDLQIEGFPVDTKGEVRTVKL